MTEQQLADIRRACAAVMEPPFEPWEHWWIAMLVITVFSALAVWCLLWPWTKDEWRELKDRQRRERVRNGIPLDDGM